MKWFSIRYNYTLVILSITASIALQLVWLNQLYHAQQKEVKQELDWVVSSASNKSTYISIIPDHKRSGQFKKFFLSSQWAQLRQSYNNIRFDNIESRFTTSFKGDTTGLLLSLKLVNGIVQAKADHETQVDDSTSADKVKYLDKIDLNRMDSLVNGQKALIGYTVNTYHAIYRNDNDRLAGGMNASSLKNADFKTQKYSYNLRFLYNYSLVAPSITRQVIYNMRYYLVSSFFMLLLTAVAFYFILRSLRNQGIYAKARQAFTGNMTHELKTPVATVSVALESILRYGLANDPERLKKYIHIGQTELQRLNQMIEKVLDLEQIDNDETRFRMELYDVQQGLQQVISSMRLQSENKNAHISYHPSPDPCFVNGDPTLLSNVFYNLIDNALKYGGKEVHIVISCSSRGDAVVINFADNGPGIAAVYHDRVFDRFFRVPEKDNVHQVNGTGLGLNYVKFIIEQHGGKISLTSELKKGSEFTIYLPIHHEA